MAAVAAANVRARASASIELSEEALSTRHRRSRPMRPLMRDVDVVIANEEDLQCVLGIDVAGRSHSVALDLNAYGRRRTRQAGAGPFRYRHYTGESLSASDNGGAPCSGMVKRCIRASGTSCGSSIVSEAATALRPG